MIPGATPQPDLDEYTFDPDPVADYIAESLRHAGFSQENAWLLATRAAQHQIDWHQACDLLATPGWTELDIVKVLV